MRTVFGTVANFETLRDVVHCNRGISMGAANTRKLPNAFTFCRQIDVLRKAGEETASFEAPWLCFTKVLSLSSFQC